MAGFDEKVVLLLAIAAHLGIWHAEAFGANPRRFRQDFQYVALAKSKAAKVGNRGLLAEKLANVCGAFVHKPTAWDLMDAGCSNWNPRGNGGCALPVATIPATICKLRRRSSAR